jgi:predicted transcriptional regulator YheO
MRLTERENQSMSKAVKRRSAPRKLPLKSDADLRLSALKTIVSGIAAAIGPHCEIVLHDFRTPDKSIVAIGGRVTKRSVGGSMSQIGLSLLAEGEAAKDQMNYITQLPWGRDVKSTTLILRDNRNKVYGAFCLNLDITEVRNAAAFLSGISGQTAPIQAPATFTDDIREVIDVVLSQELKDQHFDELSAKQRVALFRILDEKGIFGIRKGITQVAQQFGISRATAYSYLDRARK